MLDGKNRKYLCKWKDEGRLKTAVLVADGIRRTLGEMGAKKRRPDMAVFATGDDMSAEPYRVRLFYDPIYDRVTIYDGDELIDAAGVTIRRRVFCDCV